MKYYIIDSDLNSKIVGSDYPQSWQFTKEYNKRKNNSNAVYALLECGENQNKPKFIPDLDGFVLSGRAKQTNFISTSVFSRLFMNEHAKNVLQSKCNLGDSEFYEAVLYVKKVPISYYYLETFLNIIPKIKFSDCVYYLEYIRDEDKIPEEWINSGFNDCETVLSIHKYFPNRLIGVRFRTLVLKKDFDKDLDWFVIDKFGIHNGICSERFKNAVEEAGLTGLVFEPIDVIIEE